MSDARALLRERNRAVWSSGDWDAMAPFVASVGARLLDPLAAARARRQRDSATASSRSRSGKRSNDAVFLARSRRADPPRVSVPDPGVV